MLDTPPFRRLAIVVGGGPAPGINGVISAVTIEADNRKIEVYGIQDGYKNLVQGDTSKIRRLQKYEVAHLYIRGGSMLGTSRTNPTKNEEHMNNVVKVFSEMGFDALVSIGGDDTAFSASTLYPRLKRNNPNFRLAHVPKTIDNDLPLPGLTPTFGFETARHYGVSTVRNLAEDARTTSRWYLIVCMGRAAGHLALGIGKASAATLSIIPEEFGLDVQRKKPKKITFKHLRDVIVSSIIKRIENNKSYGVIVLAEGLMESVEPQLRLIMERTGGKYGNFKTDAFDNLRMGEIEFGRLIRDLLIERLHNPKKEAEEQEKKNKRTGRNDALADQMPLHKILGLEPEPLSRPVDFVSKDLGYELRCADPIPADAEYTRDLGYSAVNYLRSEAALHHGAIITFINGKMVPMNFEDLIDPATGKMPTRLVDLEGESYKVSRRYMIRLEKRDFDNPELIGNLARITNWSVKKFRDEYGYLVEVE
jgi:ATP-dependent phosphofructokinase / diphosphate-dependent phosphofructokinase